MKSGKFVSFLKKYGYYCIAGILTAAICLTIGLTANNNDKVSDTVIDEIPTQSEVISFGLPLNNFSIIKGFSSVDLQYNATMNQWEAHKAVDLYSTDKTVLSVLDGVVTNVETTYENGTVITISHNDSLVSVYGSLAENVNVSKGDKVVKGQALGEISTTASNEAKDGEHLHFELLKDGQKVDPSNYIALENK